MISILKQYANKSIIKEEKEEKLEKPTNEEEQKTEGEINKKNDKEEYLKKIRSENLEKARKAQKETKSRILHQGQSMGELLCKTADTPINKLTTSINKLNDPIPNKFANEKITKTEMIIEAKPNLEQHIKENPKVSTKPTYKRKTGMEKYQMWTTKSYFISIDPPVKLPDGDRKRFKISFKYFDSHTSKEKKKTISFGESNVEYYIDHLDEEKNRRYLSRQKGYYTPFHKNFWVNCLLCSESSLIKSYNKVVCTFITDRN